MTIQKNNLQMWPDMQGDVLQLALILGRCIDWFYTLLSPTDNGGCGACIAIVWIFICFKQKTKHVLPPCSECGDLEIGVYVNHLPVYDSLCLEHSNRLGRSDGCSWPTPRIHQGVKDPPTKGSQPSLVTRNHPLERSGQRNLQEWVPSCSPSAGNLQLENPWAPRYHRTQKWESHVPADAHGFGVRSQRRHHIR